MANLYVTEYASASSTGQLPIPQEPSIRTQAVPIPISGTSTISERFTPETRFVRIHAERLCAVKFGSMPTASLNDVMIGAGATEMFGVTPGHAIAVVAAGTGDTSMMNGALALFEILADPKAAQQWLDDLSATESRISSAASEALAAREQAVAAATAAMDARETRLNDWDKSLKELNDQLEAQADIIAQQTANLEAHEKEFTEYEAYTSGNLASHEKDLQSAQSDFAEKTMARQADLVTRESAVFQREQDAEKREKALADAEARMQEKLRILAA